MAAAETTSKRSHVGRGNTAGGAQAGLFAPRARACAREASCSPNTRLQTRLYPPQQVCGDHDGSGVVPCQLVVASADTPPVLQVSEGTFNDVAPFVSGLVEWLDIFARRVLLDDRRRAAPGQVRPN